MLVTRSSEKPQLRTPCYRYSKGVRNRMNAKQRNRLLEWLSHSGNAKLWFGLEVSKPQRSRQIAYDKLMPELPFLTGYSYSGMNVIVRSFKKVRNMVGTSGGPTIIESEEGDPLILRLSKKTRVSKDLQERAFSDIPHSPLSSRRSSFKKRVVDDLDDDDNNSYQEDSASESSSRSQSSLSTKITAHIETLSNKYINSRRDNEQERELQDLQKKREHERMRERYQWRKEEDERRAQYERENQELRHQQNEENHRRTIEREDELHKRRLEQGEEMHRLRLKRMRFEFMKEHDISIDGVN